MAVTPPCSQNQLILMLNMYSPKAHRSPHRYIHSKSHRTHIETFNSDSTNNCLTLSSSLTVQDGGPLVVNNVIIYNAYICIYSSSFQ